MSGLENFENNESWRDRLRKHLCLERPISTAQTFQKLRNSQMDTGDLETFLESIKQKAKTEAEVDKVIQQKIEEDNEACAQLGAIDIEQYQNDVKSCNINTFCTSDDSFAAMEKMCNKTASDPDSTLFKFLSSENTKSIKVQDESNCDSGADSDIEGKALLKLLDEFGVKETKQRDIIDLTQLEDIEAPSALWDRSSANDTVLQTSPVKMVGLLRPSTIIEEGFDDASTASNMSLGMNTTAKCGNSDSEESSCYETAPDSTHNGEFKYQEVEQGAHNETMSDVLDTILDVNESVIITCSDYENCMEENHLKLSEETDAVDPICGSIENIQPEEKNSNDSQNFNDTIEEVEYMLKKGLEYMKSKNTDNIQANSEDKFSVNNTEGNSGSKDDNEETDVTLENTESGSSSEKEHFVKNTEASTAIKCDDVRKPIKHTPLAKENACPKSKLNRYELNIKPMPKFNVFQKPSGIPTSNMRRKASHNDKPFDNIVSPIGVYMKKTGITPFLVSTQNKNNVDMHNSSAIRRLDNESERVFQQKLKGLNTAVSSGTYSPRSLPKKAYISSDLKKATDERTPMKVPGGGSIQKYIGKAMVPAVLRHDGKLKLPGSESVRTKSTTQISPIDSKISGRKTDINDFSIMSGDVSVYTIKPARKF